MNPLILLFRYLVPIVFERMHKYCTSISSRLTVDGKFATLTAHNPPAPDFAPKRCCKKVDADDGPADRKDSTKSSSSSMDSISSSSSGASVGV